MSLDGVLVLDKPAGPTSHDMVDRVRSTLRVRRVGHTGTLDPFATGVLPVCVGRATRLARFLAGSDKAYRARVRFGWSTTTDDLTGEPLGPAVPSTPAADVLERALAGLRGETLQRPPAFSAKRVQGKRAYARARAGEDVRPAEVAVRVERLELIALEEAEAELDVECSAGTYIRAIARDLGEALGCGAHLAALRRTRAAGFDLDAALAPGFDADAARAALVPLEGLLLDLPAVAVTEEGAVTVGRGRDVTAAVTLEPLPEPLPPRVRILARDGQLLALAARRDAGARAGTLGLEPALHPDVVLVSPDPSPSS